MEAINFKGRTRILGLDQNYKPLPILDTNLANPNENVMISVWKPNEMELEVLKNNGFVQLMICGCVHPPVAVDVLRNE